MADNWFRTDEHEEATASLEAVAEWAERIERDIAYWKWVVLALHNTLQGFMVLALRGSDGLRPLRDDIATKWLTAFRDGGPYPDEKLDSFPNLYRKVQSDTMRFFLHSKKVAPSSALNQSMKKINTLRNDFVHFLPRSWSLEVSGLPEICLDCLALVEFLALECGNIIWCEEGRRERVIEAITLARSHFKKMECLYEARSVQPSDAPDAA